MKCKKAEWGLKELLTLIVVLFAFFVVMAIFINILLKTLGFK
ncbi:MAG: hypothetical protein ABIJ08_00515 [Nanoarchaeota archaeon]